MHIDIGNLAERALQAVIDVGDYVAKSQSEILSITYKGIKNPQTNVDIEAENRLRTKLGEILPDAGFELEEGESLRNQEYTWVIDPIDGTKFFATQFPVFFTQIALLHRGVNLFSAIYTPVSKQIFHAIKGRGAFFNNRLVEPLHDEPLDHVLACMEFGKFDKDEKSIALLQKLAPKVSKIYSTALLMPYMLTNTVQAYIRYYNGDNFIYDLEPRFLLIREAGGIIHKHVLSGRDLYIAAHPRIVEKIENVLDLKKALSIS